MTDNILIAIGGTGARVVESLLPCLAAGLGPANLTIGFVDQDESNGNVAQARTRLQHYRAFRSEWTNGASRIDWLKTSLARTEVDLILPDGDLWCPHPGRDNTLASIFDRARLTEDEQSLFNLLYHADKREQDLKLGEGYRSLPHVGSAALVSKILEGSDFWDAIVEKMRNSRGGAEVRIFLAGSVFGGMGAAGYPTLARVIRDLETDERLGQVKIGGCLMLPYFTFTPPKADEVAAKPEDLLVQSQAALLYYSKLFERENIFNEIYLAGWDPRFDLGYGSAGGEGQCNPPLPPELIGALSTLRFFANRPLGDPRNMAFICSRRDSFTLDWSDLPTIRDNQGGEIQQRLGQLLRFCAAWRNTFRPELSKRRFTWPSWAKNHDVQKVALASDGQKRALSTIDDMVDDTLVWAIAMAGYAIRGGLESFQLWDAARLGTVDFTKPIDPVRLAPPLNNDLAELAFSGLIPESDQAAQPRSQGQLFDDLNENRGTGEHLGLGNLVVDMFHAARLFAEPFAPPR